MGRLQRYLRQLTAEEWSALHEDALQELRGKSLALLERLRSTGVPQTLTPSEKELAKRIERWIWKRAFIQRHEKHPPYKPHPPEWQLTGAELYYQKGLTHDAYALLKTTSKDTIHELLFQLTRLRWNLNDGKTTEAYRTTQHIWRLTERIRQHTEQVRFQLILSRLLRDYGGSYTEVGRRYLRRINQSDRWQRPLPTNPEDLITEVNLRILYHLSQGKPDEAYLFCANPKIPPHAGIYLNQWMCSLLLKHPFSVYLQYSALLQQTTMSDYERAIFLNRLLLTLLMYAPPSYIESKLPLLEQWYVRALRMPENHYVWAQLLWLSGHTSEARRVLENLLPEVKRSPFAYLQGAVILLLIYVEEHNWVKVVRYTRHLLYWLRQQRRIIASAAVLARILRQLYEARLRPRSLLLATQTWDKHLQKYPTESYFWGITLLSDWLLAQISRRTLREYRQNELRTTFCDLEMFLQHAQACL